MGKGAASGAADTGEEVEARAPSAGVEPATNENEEDELMGEETAALLLGRKTWQM